MAERPLLTPFLSKKEFQNFYWEKKELITFCKEQNIPTSGGKIELALRISHFLDTGEIKPAKQTTKKGPKDSSLGLTKETAVKNYSNDALTREFFQQHLGSSFKFNEYLRSFAKQVNDGSVTYGDLIEGYKESLNKAPEVIGKQFEYNQFCRDFFTYEKDKTRADCIKAWKLVRSSGGKANYLHYLELTKR